MQEQGRGSGLGSPRSVAVVEGLVGPVAVGSHRAPGNRALTEPIDVNATK